MKIASPTDDKIIVELTPDDMLELDIKYEDMDYSSIETRRVIWTLLEKAGKELGRDIDPSQRMMIETVPEVCGGCLVCFTILEEMRRNGLYIKQPFVRSTTLTCEFPGADELMDAVDSFCGSDCELPASGLYEQNGRYRLVMRTAGKGDDLIRFFSEFTRDCCNSELSAAFTVEHWNEITDKEALEKISRAKRNN